LFLTRAWPATQMPSRDSSSSCYWAGEEEDEDETTA
jgi:hypothetical protein